MAVFIGHFSLQIGNLKDFCFFGAHQLRLRPSIHKHTLAPCELAFLATLSSGKASSSFFVGFEKNATGVGVSKRARWGAKVTEIYGIEFGLMQKDSWKAGVDKFPSLSGGEIVFFHWSSQDVEKNAISNATPHPPPKKMFFHWSSQDVEQKRNFERNPPPPPPPPKKKPKLNTTAYIYTIYIHTHLHSLLNYICTRISSC